MIGQASSESVQRTNSDNAIGLPTSYLREQVAAAVTMRGYKYMPGDCIDDGDRCKRTVYRARGQSKIKGTREALKQAPGEQQGRTLADPTLAALPQQ